MAEYVVDTHACLFSLAHPAKLGRRARRALEESSRQGHTVWVPAAVATEVVLLRELGRTDIGYTDLKKAFEETTWRFLPLDHDQIEEFTALTGIRDPFDRLIVSAARSIRARLISRDAGIADLGLIDVVW